MQPAIFIEFIMYLRAVIKPRHCGPLHGDRRSLEARKPQRKGHFPPSFTPGLCPAFSNVRTRPASGWSDDQPRWVNWPTRPAGGDLHHFGIPTLDGSDDAELLFLLGPAMRQRAGERGDREVGGGGAVGDGFDDTWRHEGERNEPPDVALDLVLASGNRLE
jgi:hypothetical protein